jgi:hypothetical protein
MIWSKKARLQAELEELLKTKQDLTCLPIDPIDKDMYYSEIEYEICVLQDEIDIYNAMKPFRILVYIFAFIGVALITLSIINHINK